MDIQPLKPATAKPDQNDGVKSPAQAQAQAQAQSNVDQKTLQNKAILETSLQVSLNSGNQSMALLYRSAVEEINKVLEADLGPNSIQHAYDSGLDVSPEATADRIVTQTTAFFHIYQEQNPDLSLEDQVTRFTDIISGGIDRGFGEAREILDGLNVLEGDIATNIDTTYDLVQEKLNAFVERMLGTSEDETVSGTSAE